MITVDLQAVATVVAIVVGVLTILGYLNRGFHQMNEQVDKKVDDLKTDLREDIHKVDKKVDDLARTVASNHEKSVAATEKTRAECLNATEKARDESLAATERLRQESRQETAEIRRQITSLADRLFDEPPRARVTG